MRRGRALCTVAIAASAPLWVACSSDDPAAPTGPVAAVAVTPALDTLRAGTRGTLTATLTDASGNVLTGRAVTWVSSAPSVATVDDTIGSVFGNSAGTATITATSEGQSGTADVTVWVGITGTWSGLIDLTPQGGGSCTLDPTSLTEDIAGAVTGTSDLAGATCATITLTVAGSNNTGGVADSVELNFVNGGFTFHGTFDGDDSISGLIDVGCANCPTTFTRSSIAPLRVPTAAHRDGAVPGKNVFLPHD